MPKTSMNDDDWRDAPMTQLHLFDPAGDQERVGRKARAAGYPKSWPAIARRVKDLAGWRCEHCGHENDAASGHVLTVHHLDGDPANCKDSNLVALCQRCHLHVQAMWKPGGVIPAEWDGVPAWITRRGLPFMLVSEQGRLDDAGETP